MRIITTSKLHQQTLSSIKSTTSITTDRGPYHLLTTMSHLRQWTTNSYLVHMWVSSKEEKKVWRPFVHRVIKWILLKSIRSNLKPFISRMPTTETVLAGTLWDPRLRSIVHVAWGLKHHLMPVMGSPFPSVDMERHKRLSYSGLESSASNLKSVKFWWEMAKK